MTDKLPELHNFVSKRGDKDIDYRVIGGVCHGVSLLNIPNIAIQDVFISKDTVFPVHLHEEIEILIVYEGMITVEIQQIETYMRGDIVKFKPNTLHTVRAVVDCHLIGITIPSSPDYPKGEDENA